MSHYQRLGTVDIASVFQAVMDHARAPSDYPSRILLMGVPVRVSGLRLRTFAESPLCCSNPQCNTVPTHFAIERNHAKGSGSYHLNLYGRNEQGDEVLFTHDHTLARALGGANHRGNTTCMCLPCNARKAKFESRLVNQRRKREQGNAPAHRDTQGFSVSEKKLARQLRVLQDEVEQSGLSKEDFILHCHQQAMEFRKGHLLMPQEGNDRLRMAKALGMSVEGYLHLRHIHNLRMIQLHGLNGSFKDRATSTDVSVRTPRPMH